jgi:exopolyphosphatase/guanosine-5'-triphosphate,3'-diphosphate pyrophosphatase
MLLSLPLSKRKQIAGLEAGRADLIIPGILLTMRLMEILGFDEILVSDYGLLEGLIKEMDHEKSF